ncbi:cytochrome P450 306a1-like isoform X2 [Rhodnius prolixus]|uniref:cytochrome P450 306a1-like isoform X2 n=1 Tax=Rhodnius prolixus TaxID=13249 RepID=UPI003D18EE2A
MSRITSYMPGLTWQLATILVGLFGILWWLKRNWRLPPGPWSLPLVGYLPFMDPKQPYRTLSDLARKYGPIYFLRLGCVKTVVVTDPMIIKNALNRNDFTARADLYVTHGIMGGYGLIAAEGEKWKEQRKFVLNTLKSLGMVKLGTKRKDLEERILVGVRKAVFDISDCSGKPVNTQEILLNSLGNVVNSIVLGKTWRNKDPQWIYLKELIKTGVHLVGISGAANFLPFLRWLPFYKESIKYLLDGMKSTHKIYNKLYELRSVQDDCDDILSFYKKELATGNNTHFSMKQMYHVLADLCGAGTDTTLATLRWFFLYLAVKPDIQRKVQEELDSVLKERDVPCLDDMQYLPYTEACLKEAQRIRSVVPLGIPHGTWADTELAGYRIPKGTMLLPVQWAVHMNPDVWKYPEIFQPERFLDENNKTNNKHTHFMPFQIGKRMCLGDELARMLMFLFGAGIIKVFNVTLDRAATPEEVDEILQGICGITLEPGEHQLKFTFRKEPKIEYRPEVYY